VLPEHLMTYLYALVSMLMAAFIQFFITYQSRHDGFLGSLRFHIVFIVYVLRIFSRRPDVSHRHHAGRNQAALKWMPFYYELFSCPIAFFSSDCAV